MAQRGSGPIQPCPQTDTTDRTFIVQVHLDIEQVFAQRAWAWPRDRMVSGVLFILYYLFVSEIAPDSEPSKADGTYRYI